MRAESISAHRGGMWAWLFQRITAVLLIVCLAIHLILTHIADIGQLDTANVTARLANGGLLAVDIILLAAAVYHALNGLRMVLLDYWFSSRTRAQWLAIGLWVVGLVAFGYGLWGLWPYIS